MVFNMSTFELIFFISVVNICFVILTIGIYYLFTRNNYKKQKKHFEDLHLNLKVGQMVEFSNGLIGKIVKTGTEFCDIEIKSGAVMTVSRFAITKTVEL